MNGAVTNYNAKMWIVISLNLHSWLQWSSRPRRRSRDAPFSASVGGFAKPEASRDLDASDGVGKMPSQDIDEPHRQEKAERLVRFGQRSMAAGRLARTGTVVIVDRSPTPANDVPMRDHRPDHRLAAAEREFLLDQILTDVWKGKLTREIAIDRIMVKLGLNLARSKPGSLRISGSTAAGLTSGARLNSGPTVERQRGSRERRPPV